MNPPVSNFFSPRSTNGDSEQFFPLVETPSLCLEQIVSQGAATPNGEWYDQTRPEWVMLVTETATLQFDGENPLELNAGDFLLIPSHARHRVTATSTDARWLALHFDPGADA